MVLNLECRDNLTCLGRKELFPVSVPRERSQELWSLVSKSELTKNIPERALALMES